MKTIQREVTLKANIPATSKVLRSSPKNWVTWYVPDGNLVTISTCVIDDFQCQNSTQSIQLTKAEFREIAKQLKIH